MGWKIRVDKQWCIWILVCVLSAAGLEVSESFHMTSVGGFRAILPKHRLPPLKSSPHP